MIIKNKNKCRVIAVCTLFFFCFLTAGCGNSKEELLFTEETQDAREDSNEKDQGNQEETVKPEEQSVPETTPGITVTEAPKEIYVDVCGAVNAPGVYRLDSGSRVFQAIEAAGGMLPEAAGSSVNQAQPLDDGQQIYVPTREEIEQGTVTVAAAMGQQGETEQQNTETGKINLNTADTETLKTLSGIGDAKAQAIIAWREENGNFSSIEDIMQVPGIKESTFVKIKDKIAVE